MLHNLQWYIILQKCYKKSYEKIKFVGAKNWIKFNFNFKLYSLFSFHFQSSNMEL